MVQVKIFFQRSLALSVAITEYLIYCVAVESALHPNKANGQAGGQEIGGAVPPRMPRIWGRRYLLWYL